MMKAPNCSSTVDEGAEESIAGGEEVVDEVIESEPAAADGSGDERVEEAVVDSMEDEEADP